MTKKAKYVQFLGFRADEADELEEQRYDFERLQFSARPDWLDEVMNAGRINIAFAPVDKHGQQPVRALVYHAPDNWHAVVIEPGGYLVDRGDGVLRVVDETTFSVVRAL